MGDSRAGRVLGQLHRWLGTAASPLDDGPLLERFVHQRDEDAFAELVGRHGPLVFGLCRRVLGNVQDAEDVFQATFLVLARKAASIRKPESLSSWLHGVAYRLALKAKAETERRHIHERQTALPAQSAEIDLSWREVRGLLDEELQRLPEKQRLPLVLCYLEGLTQDEAARRLGWPRGTLKRRLESGRERLRLGLTRRGVTLGAGLFAIALSESATRGAVPMALRSATVQAAMQFATHETAALAAMPAMMLANRALQTMVTTKLKLGAMAILLLCCAVTAAGLAMPQASSEKQPKIKTEEPASARPPGDKRARKDRYGGPLPDGAIARLGSVRLRHRSMTASAVFTHDSKTAIAGDGDGFIVYWDVATGRKIRQSQRVFGGAIYALAITADGKTLASAAGNRLSLWDVATGKLLSQAEVTKDIVQQLLFTPDGRTLAIRDQTSTIHLWDVVGSKKRHDLTGHKGKVSCMALGPDGKTLASGSWQDPHARLWDIATGKEKRHFAAHDSDVLSVAFSPDGKTLASLGNRADLAFLDLNTGKGLRKTTDYFGGLHTLAYAPDGKTLIGIDHHSVHALDAASGKHLRKFDAPPRNMAGLAISPDSKTIATFWGGAHTIDLWDTASGKLLHPSPGHRYGVRGIAFSLDGKTLFSVAGIADYGLWAWDAATGEPRGQVGDISLGYYDLSLSLNGKLLAACGTGPIRLFDPLSRKEVLSCAGHRESVTSTAWSADSKTLVSGSCYYDKTIRVWNPATGKQRRVIEAKSDWVGEIALSPDGTIVATGGYQDGTIRVWSAITGKELRRIRTPQRTVYTLAFSPEGSALAAGGSRGGIYLWDPATGQMLRRWEAPGSINRLAYSRDGRTLASVHTYAAIRLWETVSGRERASFAAPGGVWAVAFSRDGRRLASGGADTSILIWDTTGGARPDAALSVKQLRSLWHDLVASDSGRACRALWQLAVSPKQSLPFLAEKLRPVASLDVMQQKQVDRLLAELDSEQFTVRQQAEAELEKMGPMVEPALHKALSNKPSLEVRRRIEKTLEKWAGERLRITRALEAIEHMNTPEAERLLESLANGVAHAWLTEQARAIRNRLGK